MNLLLTRESCKFDNDPPPHVLYPERSICRVRQRRRRRRCVTLHVATYHFLFSSLFESRFFIFYFPSLSLTTCLFSLILCQPSNQFPPFLFIGMNFLFHLLRSSVPSPPSAGQGKAGKHRTALHLSRTSPATIHALPPARVNSLHVHPDTPVPAYSPARRTLTQYFGRWRWRAFALTCLGLALLSPPPSQPGTPVLGSALFIFMSVWGGRGIEIVVSIGSARIHR